MDEIIKTQQKILEELNIIKEMLILQKQMIEHNNQSCKRMDSHIDMVEETYNNFIQSKPIMLWNSLKLKLTN